MEQKIKRIMNKFLKDKNEEISKVFETSTKIYLEVWKEAQKDLIDKINIESDKQKFVDKEGRGTCIRLYDLDIILKDTIN